MEDTSGDPSIPRDRKPDSKEAELVLSRSASHASLESALSSEDVMKHQMLKQPTKKNRLRKLKKTLRRAVGLKTWYTHAMFHYFVAMLGIGFLLGLIYGSEEDKFDGFLKHRIKVMEEASGFFKSLMYTNYFFFPTYLVAGFDFIVLSLCITVVLTDEQRLQVTSTQTAISAIIRTVPREELADPKHPMRSQLAEKNSSISKLLGTKHFSVKIIRLEFLKEGFTLNLVIYFVSVLFKRVLLANLSINQSKAEALIDAVLMSFIQYKNIVYLNHRLGNKPELRARKNAAILLYGVLLFFKATILFSLFSRGIGITYVWSCIGTSYLLYMIADKINDSGLVNNIRIFIFMLAFSPR